MSYMVTSSFNFKLLIQNDFLKMLLRLSSVRKYGLNFPQDYDHVRLNPVFLEYDNLHSGGPSVGWWGTVESAVSHLGIELQISLASSTGINGELGRPVYDAASGLQTRSEGFHLCSGQETGLGWGQEEEQSPGDQSR